MDTVCDLIDALGLFALIKRGALGTGNGLSCGLAPTSPDEVYFDKNQTITLDFTINGKHDDLQTLSDAMNKIHEELTKKTSYPDGQGWQITDIRDPHEWATTTDVALTYLLFSQEEPLQCVTR